MSEFQASNFKKENGGTPDLLGKTELTSPYFFVPPSGDTVSRPQSCAAGTLRFNTDFGSLEVYRGDTIGWEQIQRRESQYLGGGTGSNAGTGTRGITAGGNTPTSQNKIEFVTIPTFGNTQDFGDLLSANTGIAGLASNTRGIFQGGSNPNTNVIQFITISSLGDAQDFGDALKSCGISAAVSNQVRGVVGGGGPTNAIDYITIASTGNAVDFGDLSDAGEVNMGFASSTRGIMGGGRALNTLEFITIMTTGNATDFGDLSITTHVPSGCSNATRGVCNLRPSSSPFYSNIVEFVTIATTGNSLDFGDSTNNAGGTGPMSSSTRALFAGGYLSLIHI